MKITTLQRKVKISMLNLGLDKRGGQSQIAERLGVPVSAFNMALTGYRTGQSSKDILLEALEELKSWTPQA